MSIELGPHELLMIEPQNPCAKTPLIDEWTKWLTYGWRMCRSHSDAWQSYRGRHFAPCGLVSDNRDHWICGLLTNSLCLHYLAFHRDEVPVDELKKIARFFRLPDQLCYPTEKELWPAWLDKTQNRIIERE
jgi:hypothetical protein